MALLDEAPDAPVVPVAIDQSWRLLRDNYMPVPWGTHIRVHCGAPIARRSGENRRALVDHVHDEIDAALTRWRVERRRV